MQVILIKDLKRKGSFGEIIDVANGYALNYLVPNGFALIANNANRKKFELIREKKLQEVSELRDQLKSYASQIEGKTFSMVALSRDGKLYGSVTASVIVAEILKELTDIKMNGGDVIVEEGNIKYVGTYNCKAQFTKDISASFQFIVESDESDEQPELLEAILDEPEAKEAATTSDDVEGDSETNELSEGETLDESDQESEEAIDTETNELSEDNQIENNSDASEPEETQDEVTGNEEQSE